MAKTLMIVAIVIVAFSANMGFSEARAHTGCNLSAEQKTCLTIQGVVALVAGTVCTHASQCEENFDRIAKFAKGACDISLEYLCDEDLCPENYDKSTCKTKRTDW